MGMAEEAQTAKLVSLLVKVGALAFIIFLPMAYAIQLQLLGGIWIIQTLPAIVLGLFTRWFHGRALVAGWLAGMVVGTGMAAAQHFQSSVFPLRLDGLVVPGYAALYAVIVNLVVSALVTMGMDLLGAERGRDITHPDDYHLSGASSSQAVA